MVPEKLSPDMFANGSPSQYLGKVSLSVVALGNTFLQVLKENVISEALKPRKTPSIPFSLDQMR
jgi:hypothetical protein